MKDVICSIDTETTGLDEKAKIVELAIVPVTYDFEVDESIAPFHCFVDPGPEYWDELTMPCKALLFNGLSRDEIVEKGVNTYTLKRMLIGWMGMYGIRSMRFLGQNLAYDLRLLIAEVGFAFVQKVSHRDMMDVKRYAQGLNDRARRFGFEPQFKSTSLQKMAKQMGIDSGKAHRAVDDARTAVAVYRELLAWNLLNCVPVEERFAEYLAGSVNREADLQVLRNMATCSNDRLMMAVCDLGKERNMHSQERQRWETIATARAERIDALQEIEKNAKAREDEMAKQLKANAEIISCLNVENDKLAKENETQADRILELEEKVTPLPYTRGVKKSLAERDE